MKHRNTLRLLLSLMIAVNALFSLSWEAMPTERTSAPARTEIVAHFTSQRDVAFHQSDAFIANGDISADHLYQSLIFQRTIIVLFNQQSSVANALQKPLAFKVCKRLPSDKSDLNLS